jgi:hypothetical protein
MPADYILGLDLGQARDHSALAVLERVWKPRPKNAERLVGHYAIRHLRRWPLGASYTTVAADLNCLVRTPPLRRPVVVVDQTGVGQAVVDFLNKAQLCASLESVVITSGQSVARDTSGAWHVPKRTLVLCLRVLLQCRRLQVANLPERSLLIQEMQSTTCRLTDLLEIVDRGLRLYRSPRLLNSL